MTALRFVPVETEWAYLEALREYGLTHRPPLAFYSDRHGNFPISPTAAEAGDGKTASGRAVERLDTASIRASAPQAKERARPAKQTLQYRLKTVYH